MEKATMILGKKLLLAIKEDDISCEVKIKRINHIVEGLEFDVNTSMFGKTILGWAKEWGVDERIIKSLEEKGAIDKRVSKIEADDLAKKFWDENHKIRSADEIKELVFNGANLVISIWNKIEFDDMNNVLKFLPEGYVIDGSVMLNNKNLTKLPDFSKVKVKEVFDCSDNKLVTLKNAPMEVGGIFRCSRNNLVSLEGAPEVVLGDFICTYNELTTLEGGPKKVLGSYWCMLNKLSNLKGSPKEVGGDFWYFDGELVSLEGAPQKVGGKFNVHSNKLTSLENGPVEVGGDYWCYNNELTTLKGAAKKVGGSFECLGNKLKNLEFAPEYVGKDFNCEENPIFSLKGKPKYIGGKFFYTGRFLVPENEGR